MDIVFFLKLSAMGSGYIIVFVFPIAMWKSFWPSVELLFPTNRSAAGATNSAQRFSKTLRHSFEIIDSDWQKLDADYYKIGNLPKFTRYSVRR